MLQTKILAKIEYYILMIINFKNNTYVEKKNEKFFLDANFLCNKTKTVQKMDNLGYPFFSHSR